MLIKNSFFKGCSITYDFTKFKTISAFRDAYMKRYYYGGYSKTLLESVSKKQIDRDCDKSIKQSNPNMKIKKEDIENSVMRLFKLREMVFNASEIEIFSLPINHSSNQS